MLTPDQDQMLTRTGPGTPMGNLFRRYWIPAFLSEELPEPDCAPVRVQLLSERLIAFRDSQGRVGLVDEFCRHRRASLWFGRNESNGLRCAYHGWKYDVTGQCIDIPSEPPGSTFCKDVTIAAYPCVEKGGAVWTYMGPAKLRPAFPEFEWALVPAPHRFVSKRLQECNYMQAMEGGIDSSHVSFLHRYTMSHDPMFRHAKQSHQYNLGDTAPQFEVVESDGGLYIGVRRNTGDGRYYWRITQWVMPSFTLIPPRGDHPIGGHCWVPIDDENCWVFSSNHHVTRPLTVEEREAVHGGAGIHAPLIPGTYRTVANRANDYLMDRQAQKEHRTFSGVAGFAMQDASVQESMGPIQDRTKENLVGTDNGVIMARHRLLRAAKALAEKGVAPPAVDPAVQRVRSVAIILPPDKAFKEAAKDALRPVPGSPHATV